MADRDPVPLPAEVRAKLAELELELSEGEFLNLLLAGPVRSIPPPAERTDRSRLCAVVRSSCPHCGGGAERMRRR